jgi:hypothetical protein
MLEDTLHGMEEYASGYRSFRQGWQKSIVEKLCRNQVPIGLLCYDKAEAIGWCSIAPRDSYRELSGDKP